MKVLITGGTGFIGSHVVEAYLENGHEVVVLDRGSTAHPVQPPSGVPWIREDLSQFDLKKLFKQHRFDVINHQAAQVNLRTSLSDPAYDATHNILATIRLLQSAIMAEKPPQRFIFASSGGAIYGRTTHFPTPENVPLQPTSPYGLAKLTAERYIEFFRNTYKLKSVILRYSNVYGPRQDPTGEAGVVAIFLDLLQRGETPTIYGDGTQTRDFVYVKDVARANVAALTQDVEGTFNIGMAKEASINEVAAKIQAVVRTNIKPRHVSPIPGELQRSVIDISRARNELGWQPVTNFETGLSNTLRSLQR